MTVACIQEHSTLTTPSNHNVNNLRLSLNEDFCLISVLVTPFATWSFVDMILTSKIPLTTLSLTNEKSIPTCFIRLWNFGFAIRYVAPTFSHKTKFFGVGGQETFISCKRDCTHINSAVALVIALYSTSILELEIVGCLRVHQDTDLIVGEWEGGEARCARRGPEEVPQQRH